MGKSSVGQHHFIRSFLPALVAVLLASSLGLLGFSVNRERHLEKVSRAMAQRVAPGRSVALELDVAVGQLALATVLSAQTGDERGAEEAQERLDAATRAYDGWGHAAHVEGFTDIRPAVERYQERVAASNPRGSEIDAAEIEGAFAEMTAEIRRNRKVMAIDATRLLDEIANYQMRHRWEELGLLTLLVVGCVTLLIAARRREERICAVEAATVQRLEEANADLEAFAGRVAHDLRNPLVPILTGTEVIERSDVDSRVRRAAERIERAARRLSNTIDMLLDFSRMTATRTGAVCDVAPVVDDVVDSFQEKAQERGVSLVSSSQEVRAACEPIVIASPLENLIDNAIKYGSRAGVEPIIEVRAFVRGGMVLIEVEDRGPGIDALLAEDLFRAFRRGGDGGVGVGLGLATARRLVEARGGSIGLRAGRFGGALFQIRLPAAVDSSDRTEDVTAVEVPA